MKFNHYKFRVFWSNEDGEWVAVIDEMPSLSYLGRTPIVALVGLMEVIEDFEGEHDLGGEADES